jgi:hypothetical protein
MNSQEFNCEKIQVMLMGMIDGELQPDDELLVKAHLDSCRACREQYKAFKILKEDTLDMKFKKLPEMYWDEYWTHVYNKIERGVGWIFMSIGLIMLASYGFYEFIKDFLFNDEVPVILRAGTSVLGIGIVVLGVSIFREKIMIRKVDKYRSIIR